MNRRTLNRLAGLAGLIVVAATAYLRRDRAVRPAGPVAPPREARPSAPSVVASAEGSRESAQGRDLGEDEAHGGHTLRKHVGRTVEQLADRLRRERRISAASTFTDRSIAETVVGGAIAANLPRIESWVARGTDRPNLVLDAESAAPIGRVLRRGERKVRDALSATVVLRAAGAGWYVLTAYPEETGR